MSRLDGRRPEPSARWALFLDFDGTLAELTPRPDEVTLPPPVAPALDRLRGRLDGALAIVSGRAVADLDRRLAPYRFDIAGVHGTDVRLTAGAAEPHSADARAALQAVAPVLHTRLSGELGLLVENKGTALAVHWRGHEARETAALASMRAALERLGEHFTLIEGKAVAEIVPRGVDKGTAIDRLLAQAPYCGRTPVFIGDDTTDEHGFRAVNAHGGVSVKVGAGASLASRRIGDPAAVRALIARWSAGAPICAPEDFGA